MVINFSVGDYIIPNPAFIQNTLRFETPSPTLQQTLATLATDAWAIGSGAFANRAQQRSKASNRGTVGQAQSSSIVRWMETTDNVQTTFITLDLVEDKSYSIRVNMIVRNTTTNGESASFTYGQALAYRDTAGAAVLVGGPISLTRVDSGGGAVNLLADLAASGNNILLRVTGETGETYEWCCNLDFVEVAG